MAAGSVDICGRLVWTECANCRINATRGDGAITETITAAPLLSLLSIIKGVIKVLAETVTMTAPPLSSLIKETITVTTTMALLLSLIKASIKVLTRTGTEKAAPLLSLMLLSLINALIKVLTMTATKTAPSLSSSSHRLYDL
ncbi:MAG: hypothetical protein MPL62_02470 [Alphaproteobacteria bacterium]|nr:hypothetical protein [Alphaproteobacteria bacterium]